MKESNKKGATMRNSKTTTEKSTHTRIESIFAYIIQNVATCCRNRITHLEIDTLTYNNHIPKLTKKRQQNANGLLVNEFVQNFKCGLCVSALRYCHGYKSENFINHRYYTDKSVFVRVCVYCECGSGNREKKTFYFKTIFCQCLCVFHQSEHFIWLRFAVHIKFTSARRDIESLPFSTGARSSKP